MSFRYALRLRERPVVTERSRSAGGWVGHSHARIEAVPIKKGAPPCAPTNYWSNRWLSGAEAPALKKGVFNTPLR